MMPADEAVGYGGLQQPALGYGALQQSDAPTGGIAKQGGGTSSPPATGAAKPAKPKTKTKAKAKVKKPDVKIRVDNMAGSSASNAVIVQQAAAIIRAAGVEVDIAFGRFRQAELEYDGVIPVLIVNEPTTAEQDERWIAMQDAMNLELVAQPTALSGELPAATTTGNTTRQTIGSTRMYSTTGPKPVNALHAPVVISADRLMTATKKKVPAKFLARVFVNELSATIAHECGHAFGLVISAKDGPDQHPSDARNVMSRDTFDSLGGIDKLPGTEAAWEKLLENYQLPEFTKEDVKIMQSAIKKHRGKVKAGTTGWKFTTSNKSKDRVPDAKHFDPDAKDSKAK